MAASIHSDPPEPAPRGSRPDGPSSPRDQDPILARLIHLVSERARSLEDGAPLVAADLEGLRECVTALEQHLSTLELLDRAGARSGLPSPAHGSVQSATFDPFLDAPPVGLSSFLPQSRPQDSPPRDERRDGAAGDGRLVPPEANSAPPATGEAGGNTVEPDASEADYEPFRDQVTGLHSQAGFDTVAGGELKRCRRYGRVFSLVLFQLPTTELPALRRAANAVRAATRESDLVGRHIDRALAVALPETQANEGRLVAERIIRHLEGIGAWEEDSRVGLVTHPAHGETLLHLVEAARAQFTRSARQVLASPERRSWPD